MYLEMLNEKNDVFGQLGELVEESLEVDEHDREVRIRASFDDDLQEIAESRNDVRKQINQEFKRVLQSVSQTDKEIKLEYSAQHHHHFRATKKGMSAVEKKKEMLVIESRKDGLKFETGAMRRINAEWVTLSKKYEDRQVCTSVSNFFSLHVVLLETRIIKPMFNRLIPTIFSSPLKITCAKIQISYTVFGCVQRK